VFGDKKNRGGRTTGDGNRVKGTCECRNKSPRDTEASWLVTPKTKGKTKREGLGFAREEGCERGFWEGEGGAISGGGAMEKRFRKKNVVGGGWFDWKGKGGEGRQRGFNTHTKPMTSFALTTCSHHVTARAKRGTKSQQSSESRKAKKADKRIRRMSDTPHEVSRVQQQGGWGGVQT